MSTLFRKKIKKSFLEKRVDIPGKVSCQEGKASKRKEGTTMKMTMEQVMALVAEYQMESKKTQRVHAEGPVGRTVLS